MTHRKCDNAVPKKAEKQLAGCFLAPPGAGSWMSGLSTSQADPPRDRVRRHAVRERSRVPWETVPPRYPTHFGQMECLKLIASSKLPEKRVGYLGPPAESRPPGGTVCGARSIRRL